MNHYHLIKVKYVQPTNTRGPRLGLRSWLFSESVILDQKHSFSVLDQALNFLKNIGFEIVGTAELSNSEYAIISSTFKSIKLKGV